MSCPTVAAALILALRERMDALQKDIDAVEPARAVAMEVVDREIGAEVQRIRAELDAIEAKINGLS